MKHEKIDSKARVWVVTRGSDGRLREELDAELFAALNPGLSTEEIADALVIAGSRLW